MLETFEQTPQFTSAKVNCILNMYGRVHVCTRGAIACGDGPAVGVLLIPVS